MAGIYNRDNLAQQLAPAIEAALARRQAYLDREAQRRNQNAQAIGNFAKALGRTYETWGDDDAKLAALQKEREEAIAAQQAHDEELRSMFHNIEEPSYGDSYTKAMLNKDMAGYVPMSKYTDAMAGYVPTEGIYTARPSYNDIIKKRGLL